MTHARQQIREAVKTILSREPIAWGSVIGSRIASTMQRWPYLMIFAESEQIEAATVTDPCVYERQMTLSVAGMLRLPGTGDTYTIEDKMDEVAAEIETKLTQSALRAEVLQVQSVELAGTSMEVVIEVDGVDHAEVILSWRIGYSTLEGSPETLI
jgi:hypothetical protein